MMAGAILGAASARVPWMRLLFASRMGGYSGDCLVGVQQVTELLVYFSVLVVLFVAGGS